jgi:hypothetical protein
MVVPVGGLHFLGDSILGIIAVIGARLNQFHDAAVEPVTIRAIPLPPSANRKPYSGRYYCGLKDVTGRDLLDATVAETGLDAIPWNVEALVTGLVSVRVGLPGKLIAEFRIDSAQAVGTGRQTTRIQAVAHPGLAQEVQLHRVRDAGENRHAAEDAAGPLVLGEVEAGADLPGGEQEADHGVVVAREGVVAVGGHEHCESPFG